MNFDDRKLEEGGTVDESVLRFDEAVDKMLEDGGCEALSGADKFEELLNLGQALNTLPEPEVSTDSMMDSWRGVIAEERCERRRALVRFILPTTFWGRAVNACLMCVLIGWCSFSVAANSIPGDLTYSLKRVSEQVRMFLAFGEKGRVDLRISFSEARMDELMRKFEQDKVIHFGLVRAMLKHAEEAMADQNNLDEKSRKEWLHRIDFLLIRQQQVLKELEAFCSDSDRAELAAYITQCSCSKQELDGFKKKLGMPCLCHLGNGTGCGCGCGDAQKSEGLK